jgi:hypothetical protein
MTISVRNKRSWKGAGEYIGRPSVLGNPFFLADKNDDAMRHRVIKDYKFWITQHIHNKNKPVLEELVRLAKIAELGDLNLICWCAPKACHGDIIKRILEDMICAN